MKISLVLAAPLFYLAAGSSAHAEDILPTQYAAGPESDAGTSHLVIGASTGVGVFQDIQVPVNTHAGTRGDGTVIDAENQDHVGLPLRATIGYELSPSAAWKITPLALNYLRMGTASGPAATESSSYTRLELGSAVAYTLPLGSYTGELGFSLGLRRSAYTNVSNGHFIDSMLVGGQFAVRSTRWGLTLLGRAAPAARFGYSDDGFFSGQSFAGSTAAVNDLGARLSYKLRPSVWFDLGLERESATVTIADVTEYDHYGLSVYDADHSSRVYSLSTTVGQIGLRREF